MIRIWWRLQYRFWGLVSEAMWTQAIRCKHARALRQAERFRDLARDCTCRQNMALDRLRGAA